MSVFFHNIKYYFARGEKMYYLTVENSFDSAHFLHGYEGKCSNLHGHRYKLIVSIKSETLHQEGQLKGMVDDFGNIKSKLKEIEELFDHKLVIENNEEGLLLAEKLKELPNSFDVFL